MSYALSIVAIAVSLIVSYETVTGLNIIPEITGPLLALTIIIISFGYSFYKKGNLRKSSVTKPATPTTTKTTTNTLSVNSFELKNKKLKK
jgi:hypothetical protein